MSIASRINEIGVHLTKDWRSIEALTGEAEVDKNIENIASVLDNLWEEMPKVTGTGESLTLNTKKGKMKVNLLGNTSQTGTPTPDNPIPVNVVSGDNEVVVCGKNLLPFTNQDFTLNSVRYYSQNGKLYLNGTSSSETNANNSNFKNNFAFTLETGTYTFKKNIVGSRNQSYFFIAINKYDDDERLTRVNDTTSEATFTLTQRTKVYLGFYVYQQVFNAETFGLQLEKSSTATTYEPYQSQSYPINLGELELCKIGDYQDYFTKNSGKNLFDKDSQDILENVRIGADGGNNADSGYFISEFIEVTPNTKYTKNTTADAYHRFAFYTDKSTNSFISKSEDNTITTPSNAKYLRICGLITEKGSIQLELGSAATTYEPYGTGQWCKYNAIGTKTFDGTENWTMTTAGSISVFGLANVIFPQYYGSSGNGYTEYFKYKYANENKVFYYGWNNNITICLEDTTLEAFKTWLGTHNTTAYYVITPYLSLIEDTTLIEQLDNLQNAMSYSGTTNIGQVNNDKPFVINGIALKDLSEE